MERIRVLCARTAIPFFLTCSPVWSQETAGQENESPLRRIATAYRDADHFQATVRTRVEARLGGRTTALPSTVFRFSFRRPDRFALVGEEGSLAGTLVYDGEHLVMHSPRMNRWTEVPVETDLLQTLETRAPDVAVTSPTGGLEVAFLAALVSREPVARLEELGAGLEFRGREETEGESRYRFVLREVGDEGIDVALRFADDPPWLTRASLRVDRPGDGEVDSPSLPAPMELSIVFEDWSEAEPPAEAFRFTPPVGAQRVDELVDGGASESLGEEGESERPDPRQLVGRPAPSFEADLLDGGRLDLAAHRGERIVILDFWATWCVPCRRGMPALIELAEDYGDRVALYGIDVREDRETVASFLQEAEWDLAVALDPAGAVARRFGVSGIPQTVVVDPEGIVRLVHVGYDPELPREIRGQVDRILAAGRE